MTLETSKIRYRVDPGDVPPEKAARRLHLTVDEFNERLPNLLARGFPSADPDTGMYDLEAIDRWRKLRSPALFGLTPATAVAQAVAIQSVTDAMGDRFIEAKERRRHRASS
jgi:hypothetical protein